ncbi:MAG TPA: hypothetical protein VL137_16575, partial [Polyangiaceae bacterium]|nr:hypothetical protein [Polyangiaceae bacterium]
GLCGDVDICPNSPDNTDSNNNGICDSMECLNNGLPQPNNGIPCVGAGPGINPCQCFFGVDPIMDPTPPPSGGSGGTANAGSGGSTMSGGGSSFFHTGGSASTSVGGSGGSTSLTPGGSGNQTASGGTQSSNGSNAGPNASSSQSGAGCSVAMPQGARDQSQWLLFLTALGVSAARRRSQRGRLLVRHSR